MQPLQPPTLAQSWQRAIALATEAPDAGEALAGLLSETAAATGADAAGVVERASGSCRATWNCEAEALLRLLDGVPALRDALDAPDEWAEETLLFPLTDPAYDASHALLVPLRARGQGTGVLILLLQAAPDAPARQTAAAFAGLVALVVENDRLYEEAREALQAREHFLTALNHELRTPASVLLLSAELLRSEASTPLPPRMERAVADAEEQVRTMVEVLHRVLDLGRLGQQAVPERSDLVHPRQLVADLMRRVEPAAKRKSLTLSLYVPRNLPPIQTDAARFSRILVHLFSNAIKYTSRGGVEVRLERASRVLRRQRAESVLVIRVIDTGRGIPPHEVERIFEPFAQVEEGARSDSRNRGLGLGLPMARQLAESLGGEILLESRPGQGTTATLVLPYRH